jgi:hypothetical protein
VFGEGNVDRQGWQLQVLESQHAQLHCRHRALFAIKMYADVQLQDPSLAGMTEDERLRHILRETSIVDTVVAGLASG